ncbi:MAG: hypothetical protein JXB46_04310 [Candidatus Eisenbacteria bacterium]|nr:hypothetical protein [Candidatus Eisenbacteria bacterium]
MEAYSVQPVVPSAPRGHTAAHGVILVMALLALLSLPTSAEELQDGWVSLDGITAAPTPPSIEIVSSETDEIVLRVTIPGFMCETVVHDSMQFHKLTMPDCSGSPEVGRACVPFIGRLLAVPEGAAVEVAVAAAETICFTNVAVYPTSAQVVQYTEEGWEYLTVEFSLDE